MPLVALCAYDAFVYRARPDREAEMPKSTLETIVSVRARENLPSPRSPFFFSFFFTNEYFSHRCPRHSLTPVSRRSAQQRRNLQDGVNGDGGIGKLLIPFRKSRLHSRNY